MKIQRVLVLVFMCLSSVLASSDLEEGANFYKQKLRTVCLFSGNVMAQKHTQHEWQVFFEAGRLSEEIQKLCPQSSRLNEAELRPLYEFLYEFANDSGNTAKCY